MAKKKNKEELTVLEKKELDKLSVEQQSEYVAKLIQKVGLENKIRPSEVTWFDFRDYIKYAFGQNQHGLIPRLITKLGGFYRIRDAHYPAEMTPTRIERLALMESARKNRAFANNEAYDTYFLDKMTEAMDDLLNSSNIKIAKFKPTRGQKKTSRILNLVLSDLHFQSLIKEAETGNAYGADEEARRIAHVFDSVANYKLDHRKETELHIYILGDIIQNQLHDARDGAPVAKQMVAAQKYLIEGIGYMASAFKKVTVFCSTGNHGRNTGRHKKRAIHQKFDSMESIIYANLANFFSNATDNVKFVIPETPWVSGDPLGHPIYATHGDTAFNPGNPGKAVNTKQLQEQVNNINAARRKEGKKPYEVFICGHVHRAMLTFLDNGVVVIVNSPLCPPDSFAVSIGVYSTQCGQWLFETSTDHVVGDHRLIKVGKEQDKDKKLDKIVSPYNGNLNEPAIISKFKK